MYLSVLPDSLQSRKLHASSLMQQLWLYDRYGPGQRFGKHVDDSVDLGGGIVTEYTLLIYLTGSGNLAVSKPKGKLLNQGKDSSVLTGGETTFYGTLISTSYVAHSLLQQTQCKI